jgi:hypothetical protein
MALTAALVGGGLAAAGSGIAAKGLTVSGTAPRMGPYNYGGSAGAAQQYRDEYGNLIGGAQTLGDAALPTYGQLQASGQQAQQQGAGVLTQAFSAGGFGTQGGADLSSYDPAAVARAQSAATVAEAARRTNAIARTGGALGLREALNANANAGNQAAQQAAVTAAQGEQTKAGLVLQNQQSINATRMGLAGLGLQQQGFGAGVQADAAGATTQLGLTREGIYNQQQSTMEQAQLQAQIAAEQARQQNRVDKRRLLVGLGAGLVGAGGSVMASGGK